MWSVRCLVLRMPTHALRTMILTLRVEIPCQAISMADSVARATMRGGYRKRQILEVPGILLMLQIQDMQAVQEMLEIQEMAEIQEMLETQEMPETQETRETLARQTHRESLWRRRPWP